MKTAKLLLAALILLLTVNAQQVTNRQAQLIETGEGFHGDEIQARSGEKWQALYISDKRSWLQLSTILVRRSEDAVLDAGTNNKTGKSVYVAGSNTEPVFLVKGIDSLKMGEVKTVFYHWQDFHGLSLKRNSPVSVKLNATAYSLGIRGQEQKSESGEVALVPAHAKLVLSDGKNRQTIYSIKHGLTDSEWSLIWAGDLDKDGRLDLYLNLPTHYNELRRVLFLSSKAAKGKLVAKVAEFVTTGC
jgi:hypothetical protein